MYTPTPKIKSHPFTQKFLSPGFAVLCIFNGCTTVQYKVQQENSFAYPEDV